jgi:Zn-dependent peptidase ImmA (M78 family)/DNA-binding XRE family transcriptional regulator
MLTDAKRYGTLFDRSRLKLAREANGLSQTDLAKAIKTVTAPAISQFESGLIKPSAQTLAEIAKALKFPITFFTTPSEPSDREAFFRSLRGARAKHKSAARALAEIASLLVGALEEFVEFPMLDVLRRPLPPSAGQHLVEKAAEDLRAEWGISDGPISNVIAELERHGIVVARLPLNVNEIDAFSVAFEARPIVVLSSDKGAVDRSRFDAAHELGHLVMHRAPEEDEHARIERQAHWFAAAFLAPAEQLVYELPDHADWQRLATLKRRWGLSMSSLLIRARDLKRISDAEYVRAMKYMSMKGWRKTEPVQLGHPERPTLLGKATELLPTTGASLKTLAEGAGLPVQLVDAIVGASTEHRPRIEV